MAVLRRTSNLILGRIVGTPAVSYSSLISETKFRRVSVSCNLYRRVGISVRCAASGSDEGQKASSRLAQVQQLLQEAEERALSADTGPTPKISLEHVTVNFARSGGPGGQNVNKVNTKVDMRFNVKNAYWLSERIRDKILQMVFFLSFLLQIMKVDSKKTQFFNLTKNNQEKNRINKDGELVISSTKTRTQKGNIEDALGKLQAIIDAAAYVPPPPSEEQKKKIAKMAAIGEQKRLKSKKALSDKKSFRRSRNSWD